MTTNRITFNLALGGLLLAVAAGLAYARKLGVVGAEAPARGTMVLIGMLLVLYANVIPKSVSQHSAKGQSVQRVAGWTFVLAGLGYASIWAFAPIGTAAVTSMSAVGIGFLCVFGYCAWLRSTPAFRRSA
jgi:hypothetical protein